MWECWFVIIISVIRLYSVPNVSEFSNVVDLNKELVMVSFLELVEVSLRRLQQDVTYVHIVQTHTNTDTVADREISK